MAAVIVFGWCIAMTHQFGVKCRAGVKAVMSAVTTVMPRVLATAVTLRRAGLAAAAMAADAVVVLIVMA